MLNIRTSSSLLFWTSPRTWGVCFSLLPCVLVFICPSLSLSHPFSLFLPLSHKFLFSTWFALIHPAPFSVFHFNEGEMLSSFIRTFPEGFSGLCPTGFVYPEELLGNNKEISILFSTYKGQSSWRNLLAGNYAVLCGTYFLKLGVSQRPFLLEELSCTSWTNNLTSLNFSFLTYEKAMIIPSHRVVMRIEWKTMLQLSVTVFLQATRFIFSLTHLRMCLRHCKQNSEHHQSLTSWNLQKT